MACEVRQESDEMVCRCGKRWGVNDPEPPACVPDTERKPLNYIFASGHADPFPAIDKTDRRFVAVTTAQIPLALLPNVASKMVIAYSRALRDDPTNEVEAMQTAYRIFLDSLP